MREPELGVPADWRTGKSVSLRLRRRLASPRSRALQPLGPEAKEPVGAGADAVFGLFNCFVRKTDDTEGGKSLGSNIDFDGDDLGIKADHGTDITLANMWGYYGYCSCISLVPAWMISVIFPRKN